MPALFILLASIWAASTANATCIAQPSADLSVTLEVPAPTMNHDLPRDSIRRISQQTGGKPLPLGLILNGLAVYHLETRHRIVVSPFPRRRDCFQPSQIMASVQVRNLDVYIARELERGSCQYGVTVAHELQHVEVLRDGATELRDQIEHALRRNMILGPITAPDIETALERYSLALNIIVDDIRQKVTQDMNRRNQMLDTPAAYRAEDRKCRQTTDSLQ